MKPWYSEKSIPKVFLPALSTRGYPDCTTRAETPGHSHLTQSRVATHKNDSKLSVKFKFGSCSLSLYFTFAKLADCRGILQVVIWHWQISTDHLSTTKPYESVEDYHVNFPLHVFPLHSLRHPIEPKMLTLSGRSVTSQGVVMHIMTPRKEQDVPSLRYFTH